MSFIYLGTPYSDLDKSVVEFRYQQALEAAAILARHKIPCYCPIAAWHPVALTHELPGDHVFWMKQDEAFLRNCWEGWFVTMPGYKESKGIKHEKEFLEKLNKRALFIDLYYLKTESQIWIDTRRYSYTGAF